MTVNYKAIILFDGVCNFCNSSVQFIIQRDRDAYFHFASLQSDIGQKLVKEHSVPKEIDSLVLIEDGRYFLKSTAALKICRNLNGYWRLFTVFLIIPSPIRDVFYDFIAKNRYKWFGKGTSCSLPSAEIRKRFLS